MDGDARFETAERAAAPVETPKSWREVGRARREKIASPLVGLKKRIEGALQGAASVAGTTVEFGLAMTAKEGRDSIGADIKNMIDGAKEGGRKMFSDARGHLAEKWSANYAWSERNVEKRRQEAEQQRTMDAIRDLANSIAQQDAVLVELESQRSAIASMMERGRAELSALVEKTTLKDELREELAVIMGHKIAGAAVPAGTF